MGLTIVYSVLPVFLVLGLIRKYLESTWGRCKSNTPLDGKVFLITGANSGLGKETTRELAKRNACVIMACRDMDKARSAIYDIRKSTTSGELIPMYLDLASFKSIKDFSKEVLERFPNINVLINNAGVSFPADDTKKTVEGFEMNFGVNYLGHFLLTKCLVKRLQDSAPSRIVIVSSTLGERKNLPVGTKKDLYPGYPASKFANALYSQALAKRLKGTGVDVFALCPGFAFTGLFRHANFNVFQYILFLPIAFFYLRTAWQGAQTILHCATEESLQGSSGNIYRNCKIYKYKRELNPDLSEELWDKSENLIDQANSNNLYT